MKTRVLFVCIHNSARSQMAEAFANAAGDGHVQAESAGITPGSLNRNVVQVMRELGFDISRNKTKDVFDFVKQGKLFHFVITVCDEAIAERCPIFPGVTKRLHWSFPDPSAFVGTQAEVLTQTRRVRDEIRNKVASWVETLRVTA